MILRIFFFVLFSIVLFSSCDDKNVYDEKRSIQGAKWDYSDKKIFAIEVVDTTSNYNLMLTIRHLFQFEWRNMWVKIETKMPDGKVVSDRVNLIFSEPDGKWLGKCDCVGDHCYIEIPLQTSVKFPSKGKYTFTLSQDMRVNPLPYVEEIGMKLIVNKKSN